MKKLSLLAVLCAAAFYVLVLENPVTAESPEFIQIPMTTTGREYSGDLKSLSDYIEISLGSTKTKLVVDTGSIGLAVSNSFAQKSGFERSKKTLSTTHVNGQKEELPVIRTGSITFDGESIWPFQFAGVQLVPGEMKLGVDGNIDPIYFGRIGCTKVDFKASELIIHISKSNNDCPFSVEDADIVVPVQTDAAEVKFGNRTEKFYFDTGAAASIFPPHLLSASTSQGTLARVNAPFGQYYVTINGPFEFSIGSKKFKLEKALVSEEYNAKGTVGVIGYDVLSKGELIIVGDNYYWKF